MPEYPLNFSPLSSSEVGTVKLVELTPDLTALIENALSHKEDLCLTIKGQPNEDAVLCTDNKTFSMRSIGLSNTILVVTHVQDEHAHNFPDDALVIRDQVQEIIELVPSVPKLHKLSTLLRGREYDDTVEEDEDYDGPRFTYDDAKTDIQASDVELDQGLRDRRILIINNELRPITPAYLSRLLELILNLLVSHSMKHASASVEALSTALADDHEVPRSISTQIMSWFGELKDGKWKMDAEAVVREVGLEILRNYRHEPIPEDEMLSMWKGQVGDTFESLVSIKLLEGNYIEADTYNFHDGLKRLRYFPAAALPIEPAARFSELFLTRKKWRAEEISPFLSDIAVNSKERDKLLLKYCRAITESRVVLYTARAQYNG